MRSDGKDEGKALTKAVAEGTAGVEGEAGGAGAAEAGGAAAAGEAVSGAGGAGEGAGEAVSGAGGAGEGAGEAVSGAGAPPVDAEREAKLKAAAEARAARAAAKAAEEAQAAEAPEEPKPPSPKQPQLDQAAALIRALVADDAVEEAYVNELNSDMPTLVIKNERWLQTAELMKSPKGLQCNYLRNLSGVDYETHLEVVYHFVSLETKLEYAVKVRTDREAPSVASVTPLWATANWNEREVYDLLGVTFHNHPDLRRIMMSDEWVGHPLRKDYEPLDSEV
ncbi:NADH-quinone oxidoreductase subunit C [Paenibacillus sp. GCM10023252]|uniref:NADH-quinone oxidoreductase subunit C n=1 Tax=Paenibacillus sp. GCM10023252 TaxID=3252649 RepID=UPI00360960CD